MALRLDDKKQIVDKLTVIAEDSISLVAAHYRGLSVSEVELLRNTAKDKGVQIKVVRNTLARRALGATRFKPIQDELTGPMILMFAQHEPGSAAKLAADFQKKHDKLEVKAMVVDGELLPATSLKQVAAMPTRDEALSMLAGTLQAPVTGVVRTANEVVVSLARALNAYAEKHQAA